MLGEGGDGLLLLVKLKDTGTLIEQFMYINKSYFCIIMMLSIVKVSSHGRRLLKKF